MTQDAIYQEIVRYAGDVDKKEPKSASMEVDNIEATTAEAIIKYKHVQQSHGQILVFAAVPDGNQSVWQQSAEELVVSLFREATPSVVFVTTRRLSAATRLRVHTVM